MDKNEKLLSFIVPVYNVEKYLEECLDSLVLQDIPYEEYEIICVDDGSMDKSGAILDLYAEKYTNIVVIHKENGGVSSARNCGIDIAKGEYIWFVDSDDFIRKNCLQELKNIIMKNYDIINFGAYEFNEQFTKEEQKLFDNNNLKSNLTYWGFACFHIYKTDTIRKNNISLIETIKYGEDEMFYNDMYEHSTNVINLEVAYYFYRKNPTSVMNSLSKPENRIKRVESIVTSITILKNGLESKKYEKDFAKKFLQKRYTLLSNCIKWINSTDAMRIFRKMEEENLFDSENILDLGIPSKYSLISCYFKQHLKIWKKTAVKKIRQKIKKLLPDFFISFIKKIV